MLDKSNFIPDRPSSPNPLIGSFEAGKKNTTQESNHNLKVDGSNESLGARPTENIREFASNIPIPEPQISSSPLPVQSVNDDSVVLTNTSAEAADIDVIEKVWVDKAKDIVHRTSTNPRLQNYELAKVKADYIKKRFGKDVKIAQEDVNK